jgi:hypothetical protein
MRPARKNHCTTFKSQARLPTDLDTTIKKIGNEKIPWLNCAGNAAIL